MENKLENLEKDRPFRKFPNQSTVLIAKEFVIVKLITSRYYYKYSPNTSQAHYLTVSSAWDSSLTMALKLL